MTDKEALKIVLDLARKFCLARYMEGLNAGKKPTETSVTEAKAMDIVAKKVGKKRDAQETDFSGILKDEN
ncbi:hypothetical protein CMI37_34475 [Candidatus Pacearchaeota archaeon]|nr:hypothetical protein [Candidatus Pacearchaeota archaeon]|tara:strand:+ start:4501 stop:4710 length:210 start_codon:yes stop_codon:yes gene_type:complete